MRRFIAFIVLAVSLLGLTLFNVQANAEKINWSQEFGRGTEVVYHVETNNEEDSNIDMARLAETIGNRLEKAGATSHKIDYAVDEGNRYELRIVLGARYQADIDNILRSSVASGELSLYSSDTSKGAVNPFVKGTAEVLYNENSQAYIRVEVTKDVKEVSDVAEELGDKLLVLWQGKTEEMMYSELKNEDYTIGDKTNEQLKNKVLAVINLGDTSASEEGETAIDNSLLTHNEDEGKYYLTFDAFGYSDNSESTSKMNANSAHSFERMLNDEDLDYEITEVYRRSLNASYGDNASTLIIVSVIIAIVFIAAYLLITYGMMAISGIVGISLTALVDLLLLNLFNIQVGPAMILGVLVSLLMGTSMLLNYYKKTKNEIINGRSLLKSSNEGFRKTISTAVDSTVLLVVLGIILALISRESVKSYSIFILISSAVSVLCIFLLSKCLNNYLLNSKINDNYKLFNINKDYVKDLNGESLKEEQETKLQRLDVAKHSKKTLGVTIGGLVLSLVSILVFTFVSTTFNYSNESSYGRIEVRSGVTEIFEDQGDGLAEENFVKFLEGLSDDIKVTESWTITDQENPYEEDDNYIYFYANLENPLEVGTDAFDRLEQFVIEQDSEYGLVTSYVVHPGIVRGDFNNTLILVAVTLGIGLVYFIIRYRYSLALSTIVSLAAGTGISLGLISLIRLEVSAYVGIGVLTGLILALLLIIPLGNSISQLKNESKVKVTTFEQRKEISMLALKGYVNQFVVLSIGGAILLLAFIPLSSLEMAPIYISCIISLLVNSALSLFANIPLHLWFEKNLKFRKIKSKRAELKKAQREKLAKANRNRGAEPEEIIIPGIND